MASINVFLWLKTFYSDTKLQQSNEANESQPAEGVYYQIPNLKQTLSAETLFRCAHVHCVTGVWENIKKYAATEWNLGTFSVRMLNWNQKTGVYETEKKNAFYLG